MLKKRKKLSSFLSLLIVATGLTIFPLGNANAAAGTISNGSCSSAVGEATTATITQSGNDCIIQFTSGTNSWTVPNNVEEITQLLIVAGGGGGGRRAGGGGGAGGYLSLTNVGVVPGNSMNVTVGAGGSGNTSTATSGALNGGNGGDSTFVLKSDKVASSTLTTKGGGGGGGGWGCPCAGTAGGSSGGSSGNISAAAQTQKGVDYGFGTNGGLGSSTTNNWSGGGGGGADQTYGTPSAGSASSPSIGGRGISNSISGTPVCYAAGGGGGAQAGSGSSANNGGNCTGNSGTTAGAGTFGSQTASNASANTGSGGGGGGFDSSDGSGGNGGSGVVIIRWTIPGNDGAFPVVSGLSARFNANNYQSSSLFSSGLGTWVDSSGSGYHIIGSNITGTAMTVGTTGSNANGSNKTFTTVTGTTQSNLQLLDTAQMPTKYTLFTVARYNSTASTSGTTNNNDRSRIFQAIAGAGNWLSGFWAGYSGVSYHTNWLTQYSSDLHGNNWVISSDCASDSTPVSNSCTSTYSSNGVQRSNVLVSDTTAHGLAINGKGNYSAEVSNFQIADVIVFNRVLTITEVNQMETYLGFNYGKTTDGGVVASYDPGNSSSYPGSGSTLSDLSGNGLSMTLYGSPSYSSTSGGVLNFSRSSSQYGQTVSALRPLPKFSAEIWTKFSGTVTTGDWSALITQPWTNAVGERISPTILYTGSGHASASALRVDGAFYDSGTWYSAYNLAGGGFGSQSVNNTWYQFLTTYDGANIKFYVNGTLTSTYATTANAISEDVLRLATRWDGTAAGYGLNGSIGVTKIFDHGLTQSEVNSEYNSYSSRYISTDSTLSALTISSGSLTPTFASATTSYNDTVTSTTTSVTVTPTVNQANATIQVRVNGGTYATVTSASASSSLSLNSGNNTIDVKVTAQDGTTTSTYSITVLRTTAPTVTTSSASSITSTGATLNGTITANGASTTISTCLSSSNTTTAGALSGCTAFTPSVTTTSGTETITATATGLKPGITYYYQVIGTNSVGTTYGSVVSVLTSSTASTTVTNAASSVGSTSATLNGTVTPNGAATTNTFCWGSTSATNANGSLTTCTSTSGAPSPTTTTATISYTASITGLTAGNIYYFQSVGTNSVGTSYGNIQSFRTLAITTSTLIDGAMNDPYSVQLVAVGGNGTYGSWAQPTGSLPTGMSLNTSTGFISGTPTTTGTYTFSVTTVSGGLTSSSVSLSLRINANSPSAPSNVTTLLNNDTTVTVGWTLSSSNGGSAITYHRVDYSTDGVTWTQISATISSTATNYTVASILLTPGTPYYFRVFALNAIGTSQPVASTRPITVPAASNRSYNSLIKISNISPTVYANSSTNIGGGSAGITLDTSKLSGTVSVFVHLNNPFAGQTLTLPQAVWGRMASIIDSWNNGVAPGASANTSTEVSFQNIIFTATVANAQNILQNLNLVTTSVSSGGSNGGASLWFGVSGYDSAYKYNYANRHFYYDNRNSAVTYTNARAYAQTYSTVANGTSNGTSNGYMGQTGYLATLTSSAEQTFGYGVSSADSVWVGLTDENQEGVWEWDRKGGSPEAGSVLSYASVCGANSVTVTNTASYRSTGSTNATFTSSCALTTNYTPTMMSMTTAYTNGFKNQSNGWSNWNTGEPNNSGGAGVAENYSMMIGGSGKWNDVNSTTTSLYLVEFGNSTDFVGVTPGEGMAVLPIAVSTGTNATQGLYSQDYWMGTSVSSPAITTNYAPCGSAFINKNFYWSNSGGSDPNGGCSATGGWLQHSYGFFTMPGTYDGTTTAMIQFSSTSDDGFALKIFGAPNSTMPYTSSLASQYNIQVWQDTGSSATNTVSLYRGQSYPIDIWFYDNAGASQLNLSVWIDGTTTQLNSTNSGVFLSPEPRNLNLAVPLSNRISTTKGSSVNIPLTASNVTGSASYAVSTGSLPAGLSVNSSGVITGTPTAAGTVSIKIKVTDSNSNSAVSDYISINITEIFATFTNTWVEPVGNHGIGGMIASPGLGNNSSASSTTLTVTGLSATSGLAGATITITGTGFSNGIAGISFNNGLDIVSYTVVNDTTITITVPQNEQGITDQFAVDPTSGVTIFSPSFTGL